MTPHSNNIFERAIDGFKKLGLFGTALATVMVVYHAAMLRKTQDEPVFDATHVFALRGSQPGYATLELRAREQASYQYGYHLTNLVLVVNAGGVCVERSGSNLIVTFKP